MDQIEQSRQWIDQYASELGVSYSDLMDAADQWINDATKLCLPQLEGKMTEFTFWDHYQVVTGRELSPKNLEHTDFFSSPWWEKTKGKSEE